MNILVGIIILHAENRFISLAYMSMGWQAVELAVLSWAALFHTVTQGSHSFYLVPPPLRKVLLLSTKIKLNHYHHIGILVCRTREKTSGRQVAF